MLSSVLSGLLTGEELDAVPGCFCMDCGRTFEEGHDDCPECDGHTVNRSQR